jgi:tRNA nucleotidyltransferase/poly(A) polymerase
VKHRQRLEASWLSEPPLKDLLAVLDAAGEEARVVGGAIRNTLLGLAPGDIDIATTALPATVIARVEAAGFKAVPTGIEHGTVTVVAEGRPFEVTTLREDVETFGRRAKVAFGRDWRRDAERRDFTINGLSASRSGAIYDYVDGLSDIAARRVRFIGDAAQRIAEDYLRILRFFRFHATYAEAPLDAEGLAAAIAARAGLERLSRERVRMELFKLIVARGSVPVLAIMSEAGILDQVLAGVPLLASHAKMRQLEQVFALPSDPIRRLGALSVSVIEDAERLHERFRLANVEHERLAAMANGWWHILPSLNEREAQILLYRLGPVHFLDRVLLAWARALESAEDDSWRALASLPSRWTAPTFPLRAADFIRRGLPKGPRLGAALAAAEQAWTRAGFPLDGASLSAIADAEAARQRCE